MYGETGTQSGDSGLVEATEKCNFFPKSPISLPWSPCQDPHQLPVEPHVVLLLSKDLYKMCVGSFWGKRVTVFINLRLREGYEERRTF